MHVTIEVTYLSDHYEKILLRLMYSTAWSLQKALHKDNIFQRTKNISFYQNTVVDFLNIVKCSQVTSRDECLQGIYHSITMSILIICILQNHQAFEPMK